MAERYHFPKAWIDWLSQLTEEEMIRLTNRGIYHRALKESEEAVFGDVVFEGEQAVVFLQEEGRTTMTPWLTNWTCSCPSRSICKHIMISLHLLRRQMEWVRIDEQQPIEADRFADLYTIPWQHIREEIGDRSFEEIRFRLELNIPVSFREDAYLTVIYEESGIEVQLPPMDPLLHAVVKPANSDRLLYAAESLLRLQASRGMLKIEELNAGSDWQPDAKMLASLQRLLAELITLGLARMPESLAKRLEQYAVKTHRYQMPRIEKMVRNLKSQVEWYTQRSASFSAITFKRSVVRLYRDLHSMSLSRDSVVLDRMAGEYRSRYFSIPPIRLHALGIQPWLSFSGYRGITIYLYSDSMRRWFTYTESRPTYYEQVQTAQVISSAPWGLKIPLDQFGRGVLLLHEGRVNRLGRLSSSEKSSALMEGDARMAELDIPVYESWRKLAGDYIRHKGEMDESDRSAVAPFVACCRVLAWESPVFDEKSQRLEAALIDIEGKEIRMVITYLHSTREQIRKVEYIASLPDSGGVLLGVIREAEGLLHLDPVSFFDHEGMRLDICVE